MMAALQTRKVMTSDELRQALKFAAIRSEGRTEVSFTISKNTFRILAENE